MKTYELDGQKFRVIGKSSASNPPKEGMWIVCSGDERTVPGRIIRDRSTLYYRTREAGNSFPGWMWDRGCYSILEPIVEKKRSHENTKRLTAKERAQEFGHLDTETVSLIERQLQLHAKAALARSKRK